jgi:hypothetical protein
MMEAPRMKAAITVLSLRTDFHAISIDAQELDGLYTWADPLGSTIKSGCFFVCMEVPRCSFTFPAAIEAGYQR